MSCFVHNTTFNINRMPYISTYSSPSLGYFSPGCFDYGFCSPCGWEDSFLAGAGFGLGCTVANYMPQIFTGIAKGCNWLWNNALSPAVGFVWNGISSAGKAIGQGASNLWNKIFKKNS